MTAKRRLLAAAAAALVAAVAIWYFAAFRPESHKLSATHQSIATLQATIPGLRERLAGLEHQRRLQSQHESLLARFRQAIPPSADTAGLIDQLSGLATRHAVTLSSLSPTPASAVSGLPVAEMTVSLAVAGRYPGVRAFLEGLYRLPRLLEVTSLQMTTGSGQAAVQATFQIHAFTTQAVAKQP